MKARTKSQAKERLSRIEERVLRGREGLGQVIEILFTDGPMDQEAFLERFPLPGNSQGDVILLRESPEEYIYFIFFSNRVEEIFYELSENPKNTLFLYGDGGDSLKTTFLSDSLILADNNGEIVRELPLGLDLS